MNTTSSNPIPTRTGLAMLLIPCSIIFPTMAQFQFGTALFGAHPELKVMAIAAMGGAITGALLGSTRWAVSALAGMVAGVGAVAAVPLYVETFQKQRLFSIEMFLLLGFGALPGIVLGRFLIRRDETPEEDGNDMP